MKEKKESVSADGMLIRNILGHPRRKGTTEIWTIQQELVLACIKMNVAVTQQSISPRQLSGITFPTEMRNAVLKMDTANLMKMCHLLQNPKYNKLWGKLYTKELGQLTQGVPSIAGTDTVVFIPYDNIPLDRRRHIKYRKTVVTYRPEKEDPI